MKPIRVLIACNQPIIREGLATILSNQEEYEGCWKSTKWARGCTVSK